MRSWNEIHRFSISSSSQETKLLDSKDILSSDSKDICLKIQKQSLILKEKYFEITAISDTEYLISAKANFVLKSFTFNFLVLSKDCPLVEVLFS